MKVSILRFKNLIFPPLSYFELWYFSLFGTSSHLDFGTFLYLVLLLIWTLVLFFIWYFSSFGLWNFSLFGTSSHLDFGTFLHLVLLLIWTLVLFFIWCFSLFRLWNFCSLVLFSFNN